MFNNRMLAVAAVLIMAVPALGAAAPIVVPPKTEELVEGHTVFTVLEIANPARNTTRTNYAAAVAVLVREYDDGLRSGSRFPGVLWFNDQYLVNPSQSVGTSSSSYYYPCGGAVLAVNSQDPDPRVAMLTDRSSTLPVTDLIGFTETSDTDGANFDSPSWLDTSGSSDTVIGSVSGGLRLPGGPYDYQKSYLITDPNDHSWVVDKYNFYTRQTLSPTVDPTDPTGATLLTEEVIYTYPVWVVNMAGSPVFTPDTGLAPGAIFDNGGCLPFVDVVQEVLDAPDGTVTCQSVDTSAAPVGPDSVNVRGTPNVQGQVTDDPCAGYREPSQNGYCYQGDSVANRPSCNPPRYYNALLYFELQELTVPGAGPRDHSTLTGTDTNGCDAQSYDYPCPAGDDNAEGNSHPFHPATHPMGDAQDCDPYFGGPNPSNHGGSTYVDPVTGNPYGWAPCDYMHATFDIDVYYSADERPFEPIARNFVLLDTTGSDAPFHAATADAPDHHAP